MRLVDANLRAHRELEERWLDVMEALLSGHYDDATSAFATFGERLLAHADLEDRESLPKLATLIGSAALPHGNDDRTGEHVAGDHVILRRVLAHAQHQLTGLAEAGAPLRQVASVLEPFVRVHSVLEHHTTREQSRLYPRLDEGLPDDEREALAAGLLASVGLPALPSGDG